MTAAESPTKSSSIANWLKGLKNGPGTDSISPLGSKSHDDLPTATLLQPPSQFARHRSASQPSKPSSFVVKSVTQHSPVSPTSPMSANSPSNHASASLAPPTRPKIRYRSRSSHTFHRPLSSYFGGGGSSSGNGGGSSSSNAGSDSESNSREKLKQQRDSFILKRQLQNIGNSTVFGVPLEESVGVAEGRIYISSDSDGLVVYGRIPRVVASCGLYLKKNALDTEGIFRVAGSNKRIKQLQIIFSTPPDYGAKIDWDGFTVHDAASLLRRYLGALPEPLIPLALYDAFRNPLKSRPDILHYLKDKEQRMSHVGEEAKREDEAASKAKSQLSKEERKKRRKLLKKKLLKERRDALKEYALLFDQLPELRRQLLFYILDLLAIFDMHSDKNRMPAKNLAAIFQPSILSHSDHDLSPDEYALSSLVVEFMIKYSNKILPVAQESAKAAAEAKKRQNEREHEETEKSVDEPTEKDDEKLKDEEISGENTPMGSLVRRKHSKSLSSMQKPSDMIQMHKVLSSASEESADTSSVISEEHESRSETEETSKEPVVKPEVLIEASSPVKQVITPPSTINISDSSDVKQDAAPVKATSNQSPSHRFLHTLAKPLNILTSPILSPRVHSPTDNLTTIPPLSPELDAKSGTTSPQKEKKGGWLNKLRSRSNSRNTAN